MIICTRNVKIIITSIMMTIMINRVMMMTHCSKM